MMVEGKEKQIMLTNLSGSRFTTKQGEFYPGTAKEFGEAEALKLLQYNEDIKRTEDALKNPKIKSKITNLEKAVAAKDKEIKKLIADIEKGIDTKVLLEGLIQEREKTNADLEKKIKKLEKIISDTEKDK